MPLSHMEAQILAKMMRNAEWLGSHSENLCFRIRKKADARQNTVCELGAKNVEEGKHND